MSYLYLDSSILVSVVLADPKRAPKALKEMKKHPVCFTSALSWVECQSGLSFFLSQNPHALTESEQNLNRVFYELDIVHVTASVIVTARSLVRRLRISTGLRSMDAIHLACAGEVRGPVEESGISRVEYLTSDFKQHQAFTAEGYTGIHLP